MKDAIICRDVPLTEFKSQLEFRSITNQAKHFTKVHGAGFLCCQGTLSGNNESQSPDCVGCLNYREKQVFRLQLQVHHL